MSKQKKASNLLEKIDQMAGWTSATKGKCVHKWAIIAESNKRKEAVKSYVPVFPEGEKYIEREERKKERTISGYVKNV